MDKDRWSKVMWDGCSLTKDEIDQGYHFCVEFDGLLICPDDAEAAICCCQREDGTPIVSKEKKEAAGRKYWNDEPLGDIEEMTGSIDFSKW